MFPEVAELQLGLFQTDLPNLGPIFDLLAQGVVLPVDQNYSITPTNLETVKTIEIK